MAEPVLVTQWAVCGIAAAAARFVPVPLLDDVIRARAVRVAVNRTLRAHGVDYPAGKLDPLWDEEDTGFRGKLRSVGRRVLLFPVRKYAAIFGAVRGVPTDVLRVVLIARTVDRRLSKGELTRPDETRARQIRQAVDTAMKNGDFRLLTAALADGLSQGRGLTRAAVAYARNFAKPDTDPDLAPGGEVGAGAERVTEALEQPEVARLLEKFDADVDAALSR
jgi:hypothetical protein